MALLPEQNGFAHSAMRILWLKRRQELKSLSSITDISIFGPNSKSILQRSVYVSETGIKAVEKRLSSIKKCGVLHGKVP